MASQRLSELTAVTEEDRRKMRERDRRFAELKEAIEQAKKDLSRQNPQADMAVLIRESEVALGEFHRDYDFAEERLAESMKELTSVRSTLSRLDDRIGHYKKMVERMLSRVRT